MLILLHGSDEYARSQALADYRRSLPDDAADLNCVTFDGRRLNVGDLLRACDAMPFLSDRRMVIVQDAIKHMKAGKDRDELMAYLEKVALTTTLIFVENDDIDKRSALFDRLRKLAEVHEFLPREGHDLMRWLQECAKQERVKLEVSAAQKLGEYIGNDSRALLNEVRKLAAYVGTGGIITVDQVEHLVADRQEANLFAFIDQLCLRRRQSALPGLRSLLDDGQAAIYLLFMIARSFRLMLNVQELAAQGQRPESMASTLRQKPFVVQQALKQSRAFTRVELVQFHDRLVESDQAIKTGKLQAETALELFVLDVCR